MTDQRNTESEYILKKLDLITNQNKKISLISVFSQIEIVESLFSNYLYGKLSFADANDLHQSAPIIGEEYIEMLYSTDDTTFEPVSVRFRVYRIESSEAEQDRIAHVLYLVSDEAFLDGNTTISKSYKNKSLNFIVSDAFSKISNSKIDFGIFSGQYHIVSPNWSPLQLINYTTSFAKPKNYNGSMVMFYQTTRGFEYRHLEELYDRPSIGTWSAKTLAKNDKPNAQDEINPNKNIIEYNIIKNSTDTLMSVHDGLYSNATISYDNVSKTYRVHKYDYEEMYSKTKHLNNFKLSSKNFMDKSANQNITYLPTTAHRNDSQYVRNNFGLSYSETKETVIPWRKSMISQMNAKQIMITVPGNDGVNVGNVMNIEIPNTTMIESEKLDGHRYNNKKVLVSKITHTFDTKTHTMTILVVDDSYTNGLESSAEFDRVTNA